MVREEEQGFRKMKDLGIITICALIAVVILNFMLQADKIIIKHNGLDKVTDEDITKLREIANALEFLKILKK